MEGLRYGRYNSAKRVRFQKSGSRPRKPQTGYMELRSRTKHFKYQEVGWTRPLVAPYYLTPA